MSFLLVAGVLVGIVAFSLLLVFWILPGLQIEAAQCFPCGLVLVLPGGWAIYKAWTWSAER